MAANINERLIDYALGELNAAERQEVESLLASDASLRAEADLIRRSIEMVRSVGDVDVPEPVLQRLFAASREAAPAPIIAAFPHWRAYALRAAAAVVIAAVVVGGLTFTPSSPVPVVAKVVDDSGTAWVKNGDVVESGIGTRRVVRFAAGEVLLDGSSAIRLSRESEFAAPQIEVLRGRAVVTSTKSVLTASLAEQEVNVQPGASVAVEYEHPWQRVSADGRIVEIQRLPLSEVAAIGARTYGVNIDASELPAEIASRRVSFTGADMNQDSFAASLMQAATRFGVGQLPLPDRGMKLVYSGGTDRGEGLESASVSIAVLNGSALVRREGTEQLLSETEGSNTLLVTRSRGATAETRDNSALASMVVWAGGMNHAAVDQHLQDVSARAGSLPPGSIIHSDRLVLRGGSGATDSVYELGSVEFRYPLPGDRKGRLYGLLSTGAEFEVQGENRREFVPLALLQR